MNYLHYLFRAPDVMKSEGLSAGIQFRSETQIAETAAFSTSFKREFVKEDRFFAGIPKCMGITGISCCFAIILAFKRQSVGTFSDLFI